MRNNQGWTEAVANETGKHGIPRHGHDEGFSEGGEREVTEDRKLLRSQLGPGGASFQNGLQVEESGLSYLFISECLSPVRTGTVSSSFPCPLHYH